jgi:DNA-binding protein H-NS
MHKMATYLELKQQAEALMKQAEEARQLEIAAAIVAIKEQMATFGLTLQDLKVAGADVGKPVVKASELHTSPKYRGPDGELWAGGRGRKPDWALKVISEQGEAALDQFRIVS